MRVFREVCYIIGARRSQGEFGFPVRRPRVYLVVADGTVIPQDTSVFIPKKLCEFVRMVIPNYQLPHNTIRVDQCNVT